MLKPLDHIVTEFKISYDLDTQPLLYPEHFTAAYLNRLNKNPLVITHMRSTGKGQVDFNLAQKDNPNIIVPKSYLDQAGIHVITAFLDKSGEAIPGYCGMSSSIIKPDSGLKKTEGGSTLYRVYRAVKWLVGESRDDEDHPGMEKMMSHAKFHGITQLHKLFLYFSPPLCPAYYDTDEKVRTHLMGSKKCLIRCLDPVGNTEGKV